MGAIHWMVRERNGIDLHAALKACYFSDKAHLNAYHRPIFGATYKAMKFGPVPLEIYEMCKAEPMWLAEAGIDRMPWRLEGFRLHLLDNINPDLSDLSESDFEILQAGFERSLAMNFTERTAATHGPDWQAANLGTIKYEDMLEDTPEKAEIVDYLEENARFIRL